MSAVSRRKAAKTSSGIHFKRWILLLVFLGLIVAGAWWGINLYVVSQAKIVTTPFSSHAFLANRANNPVILLVEQGPTPAALSTLAVVRIDQTDHKVAILNLPVDLSDGQTTAGEYLESGYIRELQQMVEQSLALPMDGYIIVLRHPQTGQSWSSLLERQPKPSWWDTTVGLPGWLSRQPIMRTNLQPIDLVKALWLVRDVADQNFTFTTPTDPNFTTNNNFKVVNTDALDPVVSQVLMDPEAKQQPVSVVVENATDVSGLAALMARYVQHLGGTIVAVEPSDTGATTSSMTAQSASPLSTNLTHFLGVPLTIAQKTGRERSDMDLVIGTDVLNRLGVK
jgi:hypothetical protein